MRALVISALLVPGIPGALLCQWIIDRLRKVKHATGHMEEFLFLTMIWAVIFWSAAIGALVWKLAV